MSDVGAVQANKILVVEDDPGTLGAISSLLSEQGYRVDKAANGEQALSLLDDGLPDAILMDVRMPGMDGYEVCRKIKTKPETANIPVIFMSAEVHEDERAKGFEVGGVDFIAKPFVSEELFARLKTHIGLHEQTKKLESQVEQQSEALLESETLFRQVTNAGFEGIAITRNRKLLDCNDNLLKIYGYSRDEVIDLDVMSFVAPESREFVSAQIRDENEGPYEHLAVRKGGDVFPVEVYGADVAYDGDVVRVTAVRDISERQGWERAVLTARDRADRISDAMPVGILIVRQDDTISYVNEMARKLLRLDKSLPRYFSDIQRSWTVLKSNGEPFKNQMVTFSHALGKEGSMLDVIHLIEWPDGEQIYLSMNAAPLSDEHDEISEVIISLLDITERYQTQLALRLSEERYRNLFDSVPMGLYRSTVDGEIIDANQHLTDILEYPSRESLLGENARGLYTNPQDREGFIDKLDREGIVQAYPLEFVRRDGEKIFIETHAKIVSSNEIITIEGALMDVTDRVKGEIDHQNLLKAYEHRSILLQTAAEVSKAAIAILSVDELLQVTVDLIQERFGYYYVGIFLVSEDGTNAILQAGTGKPGQEMLAAGHKLRVGSDSMIGWSVLHAKARIALDVGEEAVRFDNPHLPDTRSEMALPLVVHGDAIGGLTVQSMEEAAFSEEDIAVLQTMADQLAIAIQNAKLYETVQNENAERNRVENLLQMLNQAALAIERVINHDDIFASLAKVLTKLNYSCMIFPYDADQDRLYTRYLSYESKALKAAEKLVGIKHQDYSKPLGDSGIYRRVIQGMESVFQEDILEIAEQWLPDKAKKLAGKIIHMLSVHKVILAPLVMENAVIGVLSVQGENLKEEDIPAITAFANLVAASWYKADLFDQAQQEITARKEAEKQLQLQAKALEAAANGIVITDAQGAIIWANPAFSQLSGYRQEDVIGENPRILKSGIHEQNYYEDLWDVILAGDVWHGEITNRRKDGSLYVEDMTITPVKNDQDQISHFIAIKRDITERKIAEESLQDSEEKFATAFRSSPYPILISTFADERIIDVNEGFERVTGHKRDEVVGRSLTEIGFWVDPRDIRAFRRKFIKSKGVVRGFDYAFKMRDGEKRLFRLSMEVVDLAGQLSVLTVAEDITDRKKAEEQLRLQAAALDAAASGIIISRLGDEITWANQAMESLTGYSVDEIVGQPPSLFKSDQHDSSFYSRLDKTLQQELVWQGEIVNRRKDGSFYYEEQIITPVPDPTGAVTHHVAIKQDITDRKEAERETKRRVQQLRAINYMGQAVTSSLEMNQVLRDVISVVPEMVGAEGVSVLLLEGDELVFVATSGANSENLQNVRMPADQGLAGQVVRICAPLSITKEEEQDQIYRGIDAQSGYQTRSILAAPLIFGDEIIGVIEAVHSKLGAFDDDDLYIFETVSAWASIAIGNARQHETIHRRLQESQAIIDISRALSETLDAKRIFEMIVDAAQEIIPSVKKSVIHILNERNQVLLPVAVASLDEITQTELEMRQGEGIAGRVIAEGQAINIGDIQKDPRYLSSKAIVGLQSLLVVPIQSGERILGTISVQSEGRNAFSQDDQRLLTILGLQAGLAIENARQLENVQRRYQESQTLAVINQALTETLDLDEVLHLIGDAARELIPASERTIIHLLDDERQALWPTVAIGMEQTGKPEFRIRVGEGIAGLVIREGSTINVGDIRSDSRYLQLDDTPAIKSLMVAPVQSNKRRLGTISVQSQIVDAFTLEDERLLTILGFQAALAIKNARLFEAERNAREKAEQHAAELQTREHNLSMLNEITQISLGTQTFDQVMQGIVDKLGEEIGADGCYIGLWDEARKKAIPAAAFGPLRDTYRTFETEPGEMTVTESVLQTDELLIISDLSDTPYISSRLASKFPARSCLALPLVAGDNKLGALIFAFDDAHEYAQDEIARCEQAAGQVALALAKSQLLEETNQRADELAKRERQLTIINDITRAALERKDLLELLDDIAFQLTLLFDVDACFITLWDEINEVPVQAAATGTKRKDFLSVEFKSSEPSITRKVLETRDALVIEDLDNNPYGSPRIHKLLGGHAMMAIPLLLGEEKLGAALFVQNQTYQFSEDEAKLGKHVASQIALAISKAKLLEETNLRAEELTVLHAVAAAGTASNDEDSLIEQTTQIVGNALKQDHYGVILIDESSGMLHHHPSFMSDQTYDFPFGKGITSRAVISRLPQRVPDVSKDPDYLEFEPDIKSELSVPIVIDNQVIGVFDSVSKKLDAYSREDERLLITIAGQLATAIEKIRLFEKVNQRLKEVNALFQISQTLVVAVNVNDSIVQATNSLQRDLEYYHVHVYLFDNESGVLTMHHGSGEIGEALKKQEHHIKMSEGIVGHVAMTGESFLTNNVENVPFFLSNPLLPETAAELAVPLRSRGDILGVLDIQHKAPNIFTADDLRLVTTVADQLTSGLEKAILYEKLQEALAKEKSTRAQLIQTEKLAAMGRLVASVAHELNNPLQAIQNALYLIRVEETLSEQSQEDLAIALGETDRMAGLLGRLRETYRPRGEADFQRESLNTIVDEVHKLIETHLRHSNVVYAFSPEAELPEAPMLRDQIKQVILNLAINAIESMPDGGNLDISTKYIESYSLVQLLIADSGPGIDPETLPNVFEPFFTTKQKGTGLGLAVSYEIIQRHGGKITVDTEIGAGTVFEILLPLDR